MRQPLTLLFLAGVLSATLPVAAGPAPVELLEAGANRAPVRNTTYAYYPETSELRVQLVLENRQVKSGRFVDPDVITHLLAILSRGSNLVCVFDGNAIVAVLATE